MPRTPRSPAKVDHASGIDVTLLCVMRLVVGLGNPGARYRMTRHNLGFMVVDAVAARWQVTVGGRRHGAECGMGEFAGTRIIIAKPQTYMNASGEAVAKLRRLYHLEPHDILVVYDDLDLPLGRIRLRGDGGAGGHNGIASLISVLGKGFPRLRVGIGRPPGRCRSHRFRARAVRGGGAFHCSGGREPRSRRRGILGAARSRIHDERGQPSRQCRFVTLAIQVPLR